MRTDALDVIDVLVMERDAYKLANTLLAAKVERLAELEAERLGQQVADEKVKYALAEVARAEKNDFISRQGWQQALKLIQMAVAALEEHNCSHSCDGTLERSLAILKTKF